MTHCLKTFLRLLSLILLVGSAYCQPSINKNYVVTTTVKQSGILDQSSLSALSINYNTKAENISYFDGLGRPIQTVITKGSASQKDLVSPVEYDPLGREIKKYLPYVDITSTSYGSFKTDWTTKQPAFYNGQLTGVLPDANAFAQTVFESSPMSRVLGQGAPGAAWQPNMSDAYDGTKKIVKIKYETNTSAENIIIWSVANTTANFDVTQITRAGYYADGLLTLKHSWDEHGNEAKEYVDKDGKVILKSIQDNTGWAQTYYIYDDFKRLRAVIQPEGVAVVPAVLDYTFAAKWMFLYRYDERGRMVMKKVPGADSVAMVYDQWDRLTLTQDGIQRAKANKEWAFTKYDFLNRPIMTGIYVNNNAHNIVRDLVTAATNRFENVNNSVTEGYTLNLSFPTSYLELLTVMHFDNYNNLPSWKSGLSFVSENGVSQYATVVSGLAIASQTKMIGTTTWQRTITYYDEDYRSIQVFGDNIKFGKDRFTNKLLWDGKMSEQWQTHTSNFYTTAIITKQIFAYDHADRILTVKHKINSQEEVTIATNAYNEIGQLLTKKLHQSLSRPVELQKLDYGYNIRGWLLNMNRAENTAGITAYEANDLFGFELSYNTTSLSGANAQYNGNISEQKWKGPLGQTPDGYTYGYDKLNRILNAVSSAKAGATWAVTNKYDEKNITYDKNGNIKTLSRYENNIAIDNLTYSYTGNQLIKVEDAGDATISFKNAVNTATEYYYDANGSMYKDDNKAIGNITYNLLNLPATITVTGTGTISYLYDATGNKLRKITYDQVTGKSDTIRYAGAFVYAKDTVQLINYAEGRIRPIKINENAAASASNFTYVYDYFLKDHLGNVRLVATTETKTFVYSATLELANAPVEDQLFNNVSSTAVVKPSGFDGVTANAKVSKLNGNINVAGNKRTGPAIILKVMAGDTVSVSTQGWYSGAVQPAATGVTAIANELVGLFTSGIVNTGGGKGGVFSSSVINGFTTTAVNSFLTNNQPYNNTKPKAFLNWMILDEQFASVSSTNHLGAIQVPTIGAGTQKQQMVGPVNMVVQKSGYLYVYVSNESNMDVFFDDVVVNHKTGPVLEETHYYPFGLIIAGLSSKAAVKLENKHKYNSYELNTAFDITLNESFYRLHDPQLSRFWQLDPKPLDNESLYAATGNNPVKYNDLLGDTYHLNGSKQDIQTYLGYLNSTTGNTYKVNKHGDLVRTNKKLNAKTTDKISGTLSKDIDKAIKSKETVSFNLINNDAQDKGTSFDSYKSGNVDMKDLAKIKDNPFLAGTIGHFLEESMQQPDIAKRDIQTPAGLAQAMESHNKALAREGQIVTEMYGVPNHPRSESKGTLKVFTSGPLTGTSTYEYIYNYGQVKYEVRVGVTESTERGYSSVKSSNGIIYSVDKK